MLISKSIEKALNKQLVMEAQAKFNYLAMASWCEQEKLEGAAKFFYGHAVEEHEHFMKIFLFINEVDGVALVPGAKTPKSDFKDIRSVCELALKNEQAVTKSIHEIVDLCIKEHDHVTYDFLRFFVQEQREEEVLFNALLDKMDVIGKGDQSLYFIDQEMAKFSSQAHGGE